MRGTFVVAALAVVVAGAECKRANGAYCDGDMRPCPEGFSCAMPAHECYATSSDVTDLSVEVSSSDMAGCACSGTTPICVALNCVSCLSDDECRAVLPSTPHCLTSGSGAGSCVGCRDASDCTTSAAPFCNAATHACRGCNTDSECPSLVCECLSLPSDACDLTPDSTNHGVCIDAGKVVYADTTMGNDGNTGLSPASATKTIQHAVNVAVGLTPARLYVHVASGSYDESVGIDGQTISIVGADGATIHPTMSGKDALGAKNNGSLTVRNIIATASGGNGGNCQMNASFTAYHTQFIGSSQLGVYALGCKPLFLDGCWVHGNTNGGINVGGDFTIINSIITMNNGTGGVTQSAMGATVFVNNTITENTSGTMFGGATCLATNGFAPINSIFYNNTGTGGTVHESNCGGNHNASDDVMPASTVSLTGGVTPGFKLGAPRTPDSYHLTTTSPCIDLGDGSNAYRYDYDFEARPDAKTMKVDIGADEVQ